MSFAAASRCKRGEEVFLSYGQLPNEHLLLFYGFALTGNGSDTIAIKVGINEHVAQSITSDTDVSSSAVSGVCHSIS